MLLILKYKYCGPLLLCKWFFRDESGLTLRQRGRKVIMELKVNISSHCLRNMFLRFRLLEAHSSPGVFLVGKSHLSRGVLLLCWGFSSSGWSVVLNFSCLMIAAFGLLIGCCILIGSEQLRYLFCKAVLNDESPTIFHKEFHYTVWKGMQIYTINTTAPKGIRFILATGKVSLGFIPSPSLSVSISFFKVQNATKLTLL